MGMMPHPERAVELPSLRGRPVVLGSLDAVLARRREHPSPGLLRRAAEFGLTPSLTWSSSAWAASRT